MINSLLIPVILPIVTSHSDECLKFSPFWGNVMGLFIIIIMVLLIIMLIKLVFDL
jgi:hypothetical protein